MEQYTDCCALFMWPTYARSDWMIVNNANTWSNYTFIYLDAAEFSSSLYVICIHKSLCGHFFVEINPELLLWRTCAESNLFFHCNLSFAVLIMCICIYWETYE